MEVSAYRIPCPTPESDGTLEWDHTTLVLVEAEAAGRIGLGYTYADASTAKLIRELLVDLVIGQNAMNIRGVRDRMAAGVRNLGRAGVCAMAISAVDCALWDLKARLLEVPLVALLGAVRESIPIYGSGGFTNYSNEQLRAQFSEWAENGIYCFKMKVGRDAEEDRQRVAFARSIIDKTARLFVDANGAYTRKQALAQAEAFADSGVSWFEEPVSSDDLAGLRLIRDRVPAGMEIAAGEYAYHSDSFRTLLEAGCVDVLQADATRCRGITGLLQAGILCDAFHTSLSAHCAPVLHLHPGCAIPRMQHLEYFSDHARIEPLLFAGVPRPVRGCLSPDLHSPGLGLEFKRADAAPFRCF